MSIHTRVFALLEKLISRRLYNLSCRSGAKHLSEASQGGDERYRGIPQSLFYNPSPPDSFPKIGTPG